MNNEKYIVAVSGGFDPIHSGHVKMILEAAKYGDVMIILNSDDWLMRKKGYVFMPFEERKNILMAIKGVTLVVNVDDSDDTVCEALKRRKPNYFANGGDRKRTNVPENKICKKLGIITLWGIGGKKTQSSSTLVNNIKDIK
jgi:cytidyltransferase-like protein